MTKTLRFGDLEVPVPGFGAMGISFALGNNLSYEEAEPVLLKALELGCTFWDTAVTNTAPNGILQNSADITGFLSGWRERKDYWRLHQETQLPRQDIP